MDNDGNFIICEQLNQRVQIWDPSGKTVLHMFGSPGTNRGEFKSPWGIAVDRESGVIIVADAENNRLQLFSSTGQFLEMNYGPGDSLPPGAKLKNIINPVIDQDGNVIVADTIHRRVIMFKTEASPEYYDLL